MAFRPDGRTTARALYSFPLRIGMISAGVLDLYRDRPGLLTAAQRATALGCAQSALQTLIDLHPGAEYDEGSQWAQIHQATGMVMAQLEISSSSALATLRASTLVHCFTRSEVAEELANAGFDLVDFGSTDYGWAVGMKLPQGQKGKTDVASFVEPDRGLTSAGQGAPGEACP